MARDKEGMTCPRCGEEMNHHANKIVHPRGDEPAPVDEDLGGVLMETYCCAECGEGAVRVPQG